MLLGFVFALAFAVQTTWSWAAFLGIAFTSARRSWPVRWVFYEFRPFYLPAVVVVSAEQIARERYHAMDILFDMCAVGVWWIAPRFFGDDDRWKRRRAKAREKIKRVGARLVVVLVQEGAR